MHQTEIDGGESRAGCALSIAARGNIAARLAWHRREIAALEQEQRDELVLAIAAVVGAGVVFSAAELFAHRVVSPALSSALLEADIRNPRQLGKRLRQLPGLARVGVEHNRALWMVS